jgi:hypothetical protein
MSGPGYRRCSLALAIGPADRDMLDHQTVEELARHVDLSLLVEEMHPPAEGG